MILHRIIILDFLKHKYLKIFINGCHSSFFWPGPDLLYVLFLSLIEAFYAHSENSQSST